MRVFLFILFLPQMACAAGPMWSEGLHLLFGGGGNLSNYHRNNDVIGSGLHFKTDVAYSFQERWSLETGSFVRFNYLEDTFIWDTLLTVGVRRRFSGERFLRAFAGKAPTVFYTDDAPDVYRRTDTSRIVYTGPVYGISWGEFWKTKSGTDWFWEISGHYQSLEKARGIRQGVGTEVVFVTGKEKIQIYSLSLSLGLVVF